LGHRGRTETIYASDQNTDRADVAACARDADMRPGSRQRPMRGRRQGLAWLLASAIAALGAGDAFAGARSKHVTSHRTKAVKAERHKRGADPLRNATSTTTANPAAQSPQAQSATGRSAGARSARGRSAGRHGKRNRAAREVARAIPLPIPRPAVMAPAETVP